MSIENPPTENPEDFNNGLDFNPIFFNILPTTTNANFITISNMPKIIAPITYKNKNEELSTKLGSVWDSGFNAVNYPGGNNSLIYYMVPYLVPDGVYSVSVYYTIPASNVYSRFRLIGTTQPQTPYTQIQGPFIELTGLINTFTGNAFVENSMSGNIIINNNYNYISFMAISNSELCTRFIRITLLRMG